MPKTQKLNCWDFKRCGRGPGSDSPCPAAVDTICDGVNGGTHAGRICWCVAGTFCLGKPRGVFAAEIDTCLSCDFFQEVKGEEGPRFQLLKLAQGVLDVSGLHARISHIEALMKIYERVHFHFDLQQAIRDITVEAEKVTHAQRSIVFLVSGTPPELRGEFTVRGEQTEVAIPIDEDSAVGFCALHNEAVNLKDVYEKQRRVPGRPRFNKAFDERCRCRTRSLLAVPIRDSHRRVIGVITAANSAKGFFSLDDQWFLQEYATVAAWAVEKSRLLEQGILAARLASIGETTAALSHSVKNIVQILRVSAYVIRQEIGTNCTENTKTALDILNRHIGRLAELSVDVLAFDPERALETKSESLNETVDHVVKLLEGEARTRAIRLEANPGEGVEACRFDPRFIYRCLINLTINAFDACMPRAGVVVISTGRTENGEVTISVSDNGKGMDAKTRAEVLDLFQNAKGLGKFGTGLSTVMDLVKQHAGRVDVTSELNKGSTFTIFIRDSSAVPEGVRPAIR